jgi:hypothetical protein
MRVIQAPCSMGIFGARTRGVVRKYYRFYYYSCELAVSQSVVEITTGLRAGSPGVRIPVVHFLISVHVPTGSWSHPASTSVGTGILFRE